MHPVVELLEDRKAHIGVEYLTEWLTIDQTQVDVFGAITRNLDPMHNDPDYAKKIGVWGGKTVLHGLFTASLLPYFLMQVPGGHFSSTDTAHTVNYGLDSLRWIRPIFVGVPIRARVTLASAEQKPTGGYLMTYQFAIEQEGSTDPCMVASSLVLVVAT